METERLTLGGLTAAVLLSLAGTASSLEVSPDLQALRAESAQDALGGRELPVLRRISGPGNEQGLERTIEVLRAVGFSDTLTPDPVRDGDSLFVRTSAWVLQVTGEGNRVRFGSSKDGLRRSPDGLPYSEVFGIAEDALRNELSPLVPLRDNEALVPIGRYDVKVSTSAPDGTRVTKEILESVAHFGRSVEGVMVVGPGSRAMVTLDNDGRVTGFDLDWSEYEPTEILQPTLSIEDIDARLIVLEKAGVLTPYREQSYVACGYYDPGTAGAPFTQLIQPGCAYRFVIMSDGEPSGTLDLGIPAGEMFVGDAGWPESVVLASET